MGEVALSQLRGDRAERRAAMRVLGQEALAFSRARPGSGAAFLSELWGRTERAGEGVCELAFFYGCTCCGRAAPPVHSRRGRPRETKIGTVSSAGDERASNLRRISSAVGGGWLALLLTDVRRSTRAQVRLISSSDNG